MTTIQDRVAGPGEQHGPATPRHRRPRRRLLRLIGISLIVGGLAVVAYVGWQFVGTNIVSRHLQSAEKEELHQRWDEVGTDGDATNDKWDVGDAIALVRIPRFGDDYEMPLLAGATEENLARGITWFPETARPGQLGNFAIAAHRVTHGEPFSRFLELRAGDEVIVETRTHIYTYRLSADGDSQVVDMGQTWVLDPVPGKPDATPQQHLITLVTCAEIFHTDNRNVVTGVLQSAERK